MAELSAKEFVDRLVDALPPSVADPGRKDGFRVIRIKPPEPLDGA